MDERAESVGGWACVVALVIGLSPQILAEEEPGQSEECTRILSGAFTALGTSTEVSIGACSGNYHLQFEDGPRRSLDYADYLGESYTCADQDTGLDHLVLETACLGSSCVPDHGVYAVNAETKALDRVFSIEFMDHEWLHRPLVAANGECLWRGVAKAEAALDAVLAPLLVGRGQDADPWNLAPGETLALLPRRLPTEAVLNAFGAIGLYGESAMLPRSVDVRGAEYLPDVAPDVEPGPKARAAFRVLQVTRDASCGVLLVEDVRQRTWAALRDFGAGDCARGGTNGDSEGLDLLHVRADKLYARGEGRAYEGSWFEIDLRSHAAKRLPEAPRFIREALAALAEADACGESGMGRW